MLPTIGAKTIVNTNGTISVVVYTSVNQRLHRRCKTFVEKHHELNSMP